MLNFKDFQSLVEGKKKEQKRLDQYQKEVEKHAKKQIKSGSGIISYDHPTAPPSAPGSPERMREIQAMMKSHGEKAIKKALKKQSNS
jgi:hypothetical protein